MKYTIEIETDNDNLDVVWVTTYTGEERTPYEQATFDNNRQDIFNHIKCVIDEHTEEQIS